MLRHPRFKRLNEGIGRGLVDSTYYPDLDLHALWTRLLERAGGDESAACDAFAELSNKLLDAQKGLCRTPSYPRLAAASARSSKPRPASIAPPSAPTSPVVADAPERPLTPPRSRRRALPALSAADLVDLYYRLESAELDGPLHSGSSTGASCTPLRYAVLAMAAGAVPAVVALPGQMVGRLEVSDRHRFKKLHSHFVAQLSALSKAGRDRAAASATLTAWLDELSARFVSGPVSVSFGDETIDLQGRLLLVAGDDGPEAEELVGHRGATLVRASRWFLRLTGLPAAWPRRSDHDGGEVVYVESYGDVRFLALRYSASLVDDRQAIVAHFKRFRQALKPSLPGRCVASSVARR